MHLPHLKHSKNVRAGMFWSLLSCLSSGIMVNMVKQVSVELGTAEIIFLRNVFAFLMFLPIVFYIGLNKFKTKRIGLHCWRSITGVLSMMIFFHSLSIMNVSVVTALSFTAPLFTAILAVYFFKDRMNIHQIFALFVGFIGVLIVVRPGTEAFNINAISMLLCAFFWALSGISIKKLSETESAIQTTFFMTVFMIVFTAPIAFLHWDQPSLEAYGWVFGIALVSNILQYSLAKSLACADFSVILPFDFTRLVFSAGIAYLAFGERMDVNAVLGSVVILSSGFYAALNERRKIRKLTEITEANRLV